MELSRKGKRSVKMTVSFWMSPDGAIHLTSRDSGLKNFHVAVRPDKAKPSGHPYLFGRLSACLRKAGAAEPSKCKKAN